MKIRFLDRTVVFIFFLLSVHLSGCGQRIVNQDSRGKTIVCFGDSLTEGIGMNEGEDYPSLLSQKVDIPIINAGRIGDTTEDALERLEGDVFEHDPKIVIVALGANDFLKKVPRQQTYQNIDKIVMRIQEHGAMVALAVVRIGVVWDEYDQEFKKIAKDRGALYIPDIMHGILLNPKLKHDSIHPNADGYKVIVERIYQAIKPLL